VAQLAAYYQTQRPTMATFVSSHDLFAGRRLWDQVDGDAAQYRLAAAGYLLQPGTPFIYYGEEVGQAGVSTLAGDPQIRAPMSWTADTGTAGFTTGTPFRPTAPNVLTHNAQSQQRDPQSIHAFYRSMLALRNQRPSIARGNFEHAFADGLVLGFQRRLGKERTLVLINYGRSEATVPVPGLPRTARLRSLFGQARIGATTSLPAQSVQVVAIGR